jgi:outer membrane protein OmpA-like peptidoglycan-associated protein
MQINAEVNSMTIRYRRFFSFILIMLSAAALFPNIKISGPFTGAGPIINTGGDEFSPSVTSDSETIVFSAKTPENRSHNIYICRNIAGSWSTPLPVDELNSIYNDETPFISADGNTIIFASDRPGGKMPPVTSDGKARITFDLYISRRFKDSWTKPQLLNSEINTIWNERSPAISRDGKSFFFTRWPYMNLGRSKIFTADITREGIKNVRELPVSINSGNYEIAFIPSYKSKTERYYFSSAREGGYGGWDIYYTDRIKNKFTEPVNAGAAVNSIKDDLYLVEVPQFSMLCSNREDEAGGFNIYISGSRVNDAPVITQKVAAGSSMETRIKVTVYNGATGERIKGSRFNIHLNTCSIEGCSVSRSTVRTSNESGYFVVRPRPDVKSLIIESSDSENLSDTLEYQVIPQAYQEVALFFNKKRSSLRGVSYENETDNYIKDDAEDDFYLMNIYFDFNSSKIAASYYPYLYSIILRMRQNPGLNLTITGHSDRKGSHRANYAVSLKRAKNVYDFISSMGIDKSRLNIVNKGDSSPAQQGGLRDMDRRVEFSFNE